MIRRRVTRHLSVVRPSEAMASSQVEPYRQPWPEQAYPSTLQLMVQGGFRIQQLTDLHGAGSPQVQEALQTWSNIVRKDISSYM